MFKTIVTNATKNQNEPTNRMKIDKEREKKEGEFGGEWIQVCMTESLGLFTGNHHNIVC